MGGCRGVRVGFWEEEARGLEVRSQRGGWKCEGSEEMEKIRARGALARDRSSGSGRPRGAHGWTRVSLVVCRGARRGACRVACGRGVEASPAGCASVGPTRPNRTRIYLCRRTLTRAERPRAIQVDPKSLPHRHLPVFPCGHSSCDAGPGVGRRRGSQPRGDTARAPWEGRWPSSWTRAPHAGRETITPR